MENHEFVSKLRNLFGKPGNKTHDEHNACMLEIGMLALKYSDDARIKAYANLRDTHKGAFPQYSVIKTALSNAVTIKEYAQEPWLSIKRVFSDETGQQALAGGYSADFYHRCVNQNKILNIFEGEEVQSACVRARAYYAEHRDRIMKSEVLQGLGFDFENREQLFQRKVERILRGQGGKT